MENWNVPAAPSDTGANKKIECKQCSHGMCLFVDSYHPAVSSNVTETLDRNIIGNVAQKSDETEKKMPDTNSTTFELSYMIKALPSIPQAIQSDQRVHEEAIKMNTEAEKELNDDVDEEQHEDEAITNRSSTSSDSVSINADTDEEHEEAHLLPCKYTDTSCPFAECTVHKEQCDICHKYCLAPGDSEERRSHTIHCTKMQLSQSEYATEVQQSYDKMCNICMEIVMDKRTRDQRFGILPQCRHVFCIKCIRIWRKASDIPKRVRIGCPVCRKISKFVCPSFVWIETYEAKAKLIVNFRKACKKIACKYFQPGQTCPFGRRCFYRHKMTY